MLRYFQYYHFDPISYSSDSYFHNFENWRSRTRFSCSRISSPNQGRESENTFSKFCIIQHNTRLCVPYVPNFEETGLSRSQKLTKRVQRPTSPWIFDKPISTQESKSYSSNNGILRSPFNFIFLGLLYADILEKACKMWFRNWNYIYIYRIFLSQLFLFLSSKKNFSWGGNFDKNFTMAPANC